MMEHFPKMNSKEPRLLGGIGEINYGRQYRQGNRVYDSSSCAMALVSSPLGNLGGYSYLYLVKAKNGKDNMYRQC